MSGDGLLAQQKFRNFSRSSLSKSRIITGLLFLIFLSTFMSTAAAQPVLEVRPITWNIVGLDSNSPDSGPYRFPVGARICNTGDTDATGVTAVFQWNDGQGVFVGDADADDYINLRAGSLSSVAIGSLTAGSCSDAYFEVEVTQIAAAYDKTRRYHITATDAVSGATGSSPEPRELYVEHLISQNRNSISSVALDGTLIPASGTMNLMVGNTYTITLYGGTATQGYEQFEAFINFPNTIFQILSVTSTYSADSSGYVDNPNDKLYADACLWDNDPNSPNYRSCVGVDPLTGKAGGSNVVTTYTVKILNGAGSSQSLNSLLYDFSGSSFHYNADYGVGARIVNIVGPSSVTIAKSFTPKAISPGGTSTMTFKINNPTTETINGVNFTDTFPAGLAAHSAPGVSFTGCDPGTFSPPLTGGETSLAFVNGTIGPNSICTISLTVTAPAGTYPNTTGNLFINGATDTGNTATDTLTASDTPPPPSSCSSPLTMATWTMPTSGQGSGGPPPPYATRAADVTSAIAGNSVTGIFTISNALGNPANSWSGTGWPTSGTITPPGADAAPYYEFVIDTSNYGGVRISFHYNMPNGDWANPGNNFVYVYSKADAGTFNAGTGYAAVKGSWQTITYNTPLTGSSTTTFRISASGAKTTPTDGPLYLDNITFSGCAAIDPPTIFKSFSPKPIAQNDTSTLQFTITNPNAGSSLSGVAFTDILPSGLSVPDSITSACGGTNNLTTTASTRTIGLTDGSLAAGASCYINVTVTGLNTGEFENVSGFISANESGENKTASGYATDTLTVIAPPDLEKSFAPSSILVGQTSTLTFSISNPNLLSSLSGISFTDTLPAGLTIQTSGPTSMCGGSLTTNAPDSISFSGGSLAANTSCTFDVTVTGATDGSKVNTTSTIASAEGGNGNASSATLIVSDPQPLIGLNKQISTDNTNWVKYVGLIIHDEVYYRFTVSNDGEVTLNTINITDTVINMAGCVPALPSSLSVGQSAFCVVGPVSVASVPIPNPFINIATATTSTYSPLTPVTSSAKYGTKSLVIDKSADKISFAAIDELITYGYLVTNDGGYPLIEPLTVADDKSADETCPSLTTVGDFDDYLDPGESITCSATYTVTAQDMADGFVTNTASAAADGLTSNTDSVTVNSPGADLSITKTDSPDPVTAGQTVTYTLQVTNNGPSNASSLTVTDTLPAGTTYLNATGTGWSCSHAAGVVTCTRASLTVGAAPAITITITAPAQGGSITNTAIVSAATTDPNNTNNSSSATTIVNASATPIAVPTLSEWGFIILVVLQGMAGLFYLRRRIRS
jgi:uncharacterized repeat protein (TIGR01451 family)